MPLWSRDSGTDRATTTKVCDNNSVRRNTGTREDRRRMNELREDIGMQIILGGRIIRSRVMWAGHSVRMEDGLPKRAEAMKHTGRRKRAGQIGPKTEGGWGWRKEGCSKGREEDKWRKAADREKWTGITAGAVQELAAPINNTCHNHKIYAKLLLTVTSDVTL